MSNQGKFIVTFKDQELYDKYKAEVISNGGTITHEISRYQTFTAIIPQTLLAIMSAPGLDDNGIITIEADSTVTTQ